MSKRILISLGGTVLGLLLGYFLVSGTPIKDVSVSSHGVKIVKNEVIGFLPYWLLSKASEDYSKYITDLTYFSLTLDTDGTILRLSNPQEKEPGFLALQSGRVDPFLDAAKRQKLKLSLLVFDGDQGSIEQLISDPVAHADNLVGDVTPIMKQYGFTDLNLDVESVQDASESARANFAQFVKELKAGLNKNKAGTLTVDVSPTDLIRQRLIDPSTVGTLADRVVVMAYDYHYTGSFVSGPVAPLSGAGVESEYDTNAAVEKALAVMPPRKIVLGIPLYGYEWETLGNVPRSATIPGTGLIASNQRMESFLEGCASCSAQLDPVAGESYLIYKDQLTGTYHQVFYPDKQAIQTKLSFASSKKLDGVALWALGYEGSNILEPLIRYK